MRFMPILPTLLLLLSVSSSLVLAAEAVESDSQIAASRLLAEATQPKPESDELAAGHSKHGEAFNEGPRQQAYLMPGTGAVKFEVKSEVPGVQKFIEQGIGQLHGFWFFEAERTFRQAAMLDPECAIAYWGMARANSNNKERAKEFIERAFELIDNASPREEMYILAEHELLTGDDEANADEKKEDEKKEDESQSSDTPKDIKADAEAAKKAKKKKAKLKRERKKQREADYVTAIETIVDEYPKDLEAKALLGYALYKYRDSAGRTHAEVDVVLDQVLAKEKTHPVHHYRIHLWDQKSPQRALDSAAQCGGGSPGIAHMWHMCGHIFSRVKRFGDAAWFQEASARVDHRHMMHDMVLPDQIHNFAHNNEWLIRNLMNVGRTGDALDLAKNMIELPRHPKYNMLDKRNSSSYGRDRLMNVLERFELWEDTIELAQGPYLEPTDDHEEQLKRLRLLGKAYAKSDQLASAHDVVAELEAKLDELKSDSPKLEDKDADKDDEENSEAASSDTEEAADKEADNKEADNKEADNKEADNKEADNKEADNKEADNKVADGAADKEGCGKAEQEAKKQRDKEFKKKKDAHKRKLERVERVERDIACVTGYIALARGEATEAMTLLDKADEDGLSKARVRVISGDPEKAVKDAKQYVKDRKQQVQPLTGLVEVAWAAGDREAAADAFIRLRARSNWIDMASPVFTRLQPIAEELGYQGDWRIQLPNAEDLGKQPELDSLGPFRWQPAPAPDWLLSDSDGQLHSMREYRSRPVIMVFYLGYGCLHCAEQLQAIAPRTEEFEAAGISLIAVSADNLDGLLKSQENYDGDKMPFPLVANPDNDVFKAFRAYDDFEDLPLHGTYLIDGEGHIRWQDISYDPFMDVDFLLNESKRLLGQRKRKPTTSKGELATAAPK